MNKLKYMTRKSSFKPHFPLMLRKGSNSVKLKPTIYEEMKQLLPLPLSKNCG